MIRGPILPQLRQSLWALVSPRLDRIESGLRVVLESLDCSDGDLGCVDGLARDASGGAVLLLLAIDGDALLSARVLAAGRFAARVGDALMHAVPEANFSPERPARVLVVGSRASEALLAEVAALPIEALEVCALEPFRVAGSERFCVRWVSPTTGAEAAASFVPPAGREALWLRLEGICARMDTGVQLGGDRYSRRITYRGHVLGLVRVVDGSLLVATASGSAYELADLRDLRRFADAMLRQVLELSGAVMADPAASAPPASARRRAVDSATDAGRHPATRHAAGGSSSRRESLGASLAAARLSPEEYSALGGTASSAVPDAGGSVAKD